MNMAKPKNTKTTKWKLIVSSPMRFLTRDAAVEWGRNYKLPYTIEKKPPLKGSSYPNSWVLRVYQPTLWKGRKVEGSSNYGIPYLTKKQAMGSYRYGSKKWELVRIRGGAWIYVEVKQERYIGVSINTRRKFGSKTYYHHMTDNRRVWSLKYAAKLREVGYLARVSKTSRFDKRYPFWDIWVAPKGMAKVKDHRYM